MDDRTYNLWINALAVLASCICTLGFIMLAIHFETWWIALFSLLFQWGIEHKGRSDTKQ